jgi:CO/xanthine dehydrogenase Mo-binding subunit
MEHTTEAVLLAKATGRAVKVVWTREEDLRVDQHRTAFLGRARLGLGGDGMPVVYEAKIACDGSGPCRAWIKCKNPEFVAAQRDRAAGWIW